MSSAFSRNEDEESEITLSTASLLGLFLGLVLVCGVFFGFGYFMGGRSATSAAAAPAAANDGAESGTAAELAAAKPSTQESGSDESAAAVTDDSASSARGNVSSPVANDTFSPSRPETPIEAAQSQPVPLPTIETPAPQPARVLTTQPEQPAAKAIATQQTPMPAAAQAPAPAPAPFRDQATLREAMVQVAAVVHPEDAQVLVSALRRHGYSAVVRNEPQDKLLHIQVGPFPTRVQANTMRQKLLSDGYDAIIKQ